MCPERSSAAIQANANHALAAKANRWQGLARFSSLGGQAGTEERACACLWNTAHGWKPDARTSAKSSRPRGGKVAGRVATGIATAARQRIQACSACIVAAHAESHNGGRIQPAGTISMRFRVDLNLHGWPVRTNLPPGYPAVAVPSVTLVTSAVAHGYFHASMARSL